MSALKIIVTVIYCIGAIAFTASVLMQEGKSAGLGAIGGMAESYCCLLYTSPSPRD